MSDYGIVSCAWNWDEGTTGTCTSAMSSVPGRITTVSTWNPVTKVCSNWLSVIPAINNFVLTPGLAYWIYARTSGTLTYEPADRPVASFTYTVDGLAVNVDASASSGYGILSYTWDWGDGSASETYASPTATHNYGSSFSAVSDPTASSSRDGRGMEEPDMVGGTTYASDGTILTGCSVTVTNLRSGQVVNTISDDYNGGYAVTLTSDRPGDVIEVTAIKGNCYGANSGAFEYGGGFDFLWLDVTLDGVIATITLTVTDAAGQIDTMNRTVAWVASPNASFTVSPPMGYPTTIFTFDASSSSDAETPLSELQVRWDWEDDGIWDTNWSTKKQAEHQYAQHGTYKVRLEVMDTDGFIGFALMDFLVDYFAPGWIGVTIDSAGDVGIDSSIALDSNNKVHMSYNRGDGDLMYATNEAGSWALSRIDSSWDWGGRTSIALDSNDKAHVSYHEYLNLDLKYATNANGSWSTYTIDSAGNVGLDSSIAVDSKNHVHISYTDETNWDLKYATNANGHWEWLTLDSAGYVGTDSSIAIDSNDKVHISYCDWTNDDLKYATNANGPWVCRALDNLGSIFETSIAVDSNNKIHISYCDFWNWDLKYATNAGGAWACYTLDSAGDVGLYSSIAVDSNNKIHICYSDSHNGALKYASDAGGPWACSTLDSMGSIGPYNAIAVDSSDKVHISYYYNADSDLKYMYEA